MVFDENSATIVSILKLVCFVGACSLVKYVSTLDAGTFLDHLDRCTSLGLVKTRLLTLHPFLSLVEILCLRL